MQTVQPAPMPGPIILAKVGKYPAGKMETTPRETADKARKGLGDRLVGAVGGLCVMSCVGLSVGASIHRQWAGLLWLLAGWTPWLLLLAACVWHERRKRRTDEAPSSEPNVSSPPDERAVVVVDRLKEYTGTGALGNPVRATGTTAWLTEEGLYLSTGRLLPWRRFARFRLEPPSQAAYRVRLRWRPQVAAPGIALGLAVLLLLLGGWAVQVVGGMHEWHRHGTRDDVLALLFGAFLTLWTILYLTTRFLHDFTGAAPTDKAGDWLALINRQDTSDEAVFALLRRHLSPLDSGR